MGEHLKYLVYALGRPLACLAWSLGAAAPGSRATGLSGGQPRRGGKTSVCWPTTRRFLIVPWVSVPHLASHILGRMARLLPGDWERVYGHPVYFLETFVDPAAIPRHLLPRRQLDLLGRTTGRGKDSQSKRPNRSIKEVLGYPLTKDFRQLLAQVR